MRTWREVRNFAYKKFRKSEISLDTRGVQDPDFRTGVWQGLAHFEQIGSDPDYGFIQVSGSGFLNKFFGDLTPTQS